MKDITQLTQKRWLTTNDFFLEFNFSISFQAKLRSKAAIPYTKVGRKIFYDRKEINAWLEDHSVVKKISCIHKDLK